jgi:hypothetical protein
MTPLFMRITARLSIALMLCFTLPMQTVQAAMIGTSQVAAQAGPDQRARVIDFLERQDVRQAMESYGVSAADAKTRVAAMTDEEIASLDKKIGDLPAGGDANILGILFAIFIILLITDILGLTKIFPFTRSVR